MTLQRPCYYLLCALRSAKLVLAHTPLQARGQSAKSTLRATVQAHKTSATHLLKMVFFTKTLFRSTSP